MKGNIKFFSIVLALLLASFAVLTGFMFAIASENGGMKSYNLGSQIDNKNGSPGENGDGNFVIEGDAPVAQSEMQKKFAAMYDISEDGKSITVISEKYLNDYWQSNYEKEVIRSLNTEEVYFIIQDSIRIYAEYEKVILPGFASYSSLSYVAERFPFVKDEVIDTKPMQSGWFHEEDLSGIYAIILYRLTALSSPKAFFTGAEALRFVGKNPDIYSSWFPQTIFYIPGFSDETDRDYILTIMGGTSDFTDLERFSDLFIVSAWGEPLIEFSSISNGSKTQVFPTVEIEQLYSGFYTTTPGGYEYDNNGKLPVEIVYGPSFYLNRKGTFVLSMSSLMSGALSGNYTRMENKLLFLGYNSLEGEDYQYVFCYQEGEGYRYSKEESTPASGYDFENGTMFYFDRISDIMENWDPSGSERPVQNIKDRAEDEGIPTDEAEEPFFEDENYIYSFPSIRSKYVIVTFADGTEMPVKEALEKGYITIRALDVYAIQYLIREKN